MVLEAFLAKCGNKRKEGLVHFSTRRALSTRFRKIGKEGISGWNTCKCCTPKDRARQDQQNEIEGSRPIKAELGENGVCVKSSCSTRH